MSPIIRALLFAFGLASMTGCVAYVPTAEPYSGSGAYYHDRGYWAAPRPYGGWGHHHWHHGHRGHH